MTSTIHEPKDGNRKLNDDAAIWQAFSTPRNDNEFYQAWLSLLCPQLPDIKAGIVLLQTTDTNTFMPIAIWPSVPRDLSYFGKIAQRALAEERGIVQHTNESGEDRVHLAYPLKVSGRVIGAIVLESGAHSDAAANALQRLLYWNIGWLHDLIHRRELDEISSKTERITSIMEAVATALRFGVLKQTLFELVNYLAHTAECSRVVLGLAEHGTVHIAALSNAAWFEKNTNIIKRYVAAMEEAYDRFSTVVLHRKAEDDPTTELELSTAHAFLMQESGSLAILSVPLLLGAKCIGVLTLERDVDKPFSQLEIEWAETLATLLPAIIDQKKRAERGYLAHLHDDTKKLMNRLFGPRYLIWKFASSFILLTVVVLTVIHIDYRVTAKTVIEGEIQRAAVAPFEGYVAATYVRAGDLVRQGQVLCELDNRDLELERHKRASERSQQALKLRVAMANHDLTEIQALSAQLQQAEAQLGLVTERLSRAKLTAPFDGIVISGDLHQLIGSPVESGKKLFEIAPLDAYRVILQVDEREVRHVQAGQTGTLLISGIAGDPIPFDVINTTPVAVAQDGRNFFRVEARLQTSPPRLRPGMEGIGKVSVGERRLWWILTHSFTDWLRVTLWKWMP